MESFFVLFRCPKCHHSMEIVDLDKLKCTRCDKEYSAEETKPRITNRRGKTQLEKAGVIVYSLLPDLSFATFMVTQSIFEMEGAEEVNGAAHLKRIVLVDENKKNPTEIFRGANFSEEKFKKRISSHTPLLDL